MARNTIVKYPGGKTRGVKVLEKYIPSESRTLLSPFFGGGSFENYLANTRGMEVEGYDYLWPLASFWQSYIDRKEDIWESLRNHYYEIQRGEAPLWEVSEKEREEQKAIRKRWQEEAVNNKDPFESGRHWFALNRSSFSGFCLLGKTPTNSETLFKVMGPTYQENLKNFNFGVKSVGFGSCFDTLTSGDRYDIVYLDPPYIFQDRSKEGLYGHKGSLHSGFDHEKLAEILRGYKGKWILSYLDVPEVRRMYEGFNIHEETWTYTIKCNDNKGRKGEELVITNF